MLIYQPKYVRTTFVVFNQNKNAFDWTIMPSTNSTVSFLRMIATRSPAIDKTKR